MKMDGNKNAKTPIIEVKDLKFSALASQETNCYQATIYVNNQPAFYAENNGNGGPDRYHPIGDNIGLYYEAKNYIESLPPVEAFGMVLPMDTEMFIAEMVNEIIETKRLAKLCKKNTLFTIPGITGEGEYRTVNNVGESAEKWIMNKYPTAIIYRP